MRKKGWWKKSASVLIAAAMLMTSVPVYAAPLDEQAQEVVVQEQTEDADKEAVEISLEDETDGVENSDEEQVAIEEDGKEEVVAVSREEASVEVDSNGTRNYYTTLGDAVTAAAAGTASMITLLKNVTDEAIIFIIQGKKITLDLNGYDVGFGANGCLRVIYGTLNVTGTGKLYEQTPTYGPIVVTGKANMQECATVTVGENVTLEGWSGIFVDNNNGYADGVNITLDGSIQGRQDAEGDPGYGIYINGSIQGTNGYIPTITIGSTASIKTPGDGIYAAGHAKWYLNGGSIEGATALSIKSGIFDITGGTYHSTGAFVNPPVADISGQEDTGAALNVTSNDGYAKKTVVNITGGTFVSDNGYAVYEGIAKDANGKPAANASYAELTISGGFFKASNITESVSINTMTDKNVISGGYFNAPFDTDYVVKDDRGLQLLVNKDEYKDEYGYVVGVPSPSPVPPSSESSNNNLSSLTLSEGTLAPAFDKDTVSYTASVDNATESITVTTVTEDPLATIQVNGTSVESGKASAPIALKEGENTITVVVTAQNGDQKTYTIKVTRAKAELGSDASLAGLTISKGTLSPKFSAEREEYTAIVENAVSSIVVTPKTADENSTVTVNGKAASEKVALKVGYNTIKVKVTSADGTATKTYTIRVTRVVPKNYTITISRRKYKVTNELIAKASVAITGLSDNKVINLSVPDTIKIYGVTYKITSVGKNAFRGQPKMKTAKIGKNVTTINYAAFYACPLLNSVTLGKNVKTIGNHVFCRDSKLRTLTMEGTALTKVGNHVLYQVTNLTIKAPGSKVNAYKKLFTNKGSKSFKVVKK